MDTIHIFLLIKIFQSLSDKFMCLQILPELFMVPMKKLIQWLIRVLQDLEKMDKVRLSKDFGELFRYLQQQIFNQIPGVSAISGLLMGAWVASTFTTSPIKGFLASWGIIKGGTRVVSKTTYSFLSFALPILAAAITAFIVQKAMKAYREKQLCRNKALVAQLGSAIQSEIGEKMNILEKAKEMGLVSEGEYLTKRANLYQTYVRSFPFKIEEFLLKKWTS
jgi:hypothetical protein